MSLSKILHNRIWIIMWMLTGILFLASCGKQEIDKPVISDTGFIPARAGMYDCADTAVVTAIDRQDKTITFFNLIVERYYTLNYDGTSKIADKYNSSMSMEQIMPGDIVDVTFLKSKKLLNSMKLSEQAWTLSDVTRFEIKQDKNEITIASDIFQYTDNILVLSDEPDAQIIDINQCDRLAMQGIGNTVYSITVSRGHGYLRLKNDEYFLGGWIEVGQEIIRTISPDMLLVVPEGSYDVLLSAQGVSGSKKITVKRNKETELDIGDLKGEDIKKYGNLIFSVTPYSAEVYIDGEEIDISKPFKAEYGIHQMMARAEGYQTVTQYIKVGQDNATIQVTLEKQGEKKAETVSSNTVPSPSVSVTPTPTITPTPTPTPAITPTSSVSANTAVSTTGYKVTIDAPADVEIYVDGNYVGISPVSFSKVEGLHVITLRKNGYATRSYTISVDGEKKDAGFSFSDLVADN